MHRRSARMFAMFGSVAAVGTAHADFIYQTLGERPDRDFAMIGFEDAAVGGAITLLDFGDGIAASVTTQSNVSNRVFSGTDGYGAVAAEGERFWKLAGGTTTLDFGDALLTGIEFMYSDLEWATLVMQFDNGTEVWLDDDNPNSPVLFGYAADAGSPFSSVSITWRGTQTDGVGFDQLAVTAIPSPGTGTMMLAAGMLAIRRRRTRPAA